jgi:hypothetical protein
LKELEGEAPAEPRILIDLIALRSQWKARAAHWDLRWSIFDVDSLAARRTSKMEHPKSRRGRSCDSCGRNLWRDQEICRVSET